MDSNHMYKNTVTVVGAGSFGIAIANIIAENSPVCLYTRNPETYKELLAGSRNEIKLHPNITPSTSLEESIESSEIVFITIPSSSYFDFFKEAVSYFSPSQLVIHGTKGLLTKQPIDTYDKISKEEIYTISDIILQESCIIKVGCISGPNLAKELNERQPAATVLASRFDQVIKRGEKILKTDRFMVYNSYDIKGIELAGVLKNVISIASGILTGMGLGDNTRSFLISRGLIEMMNIAKVLGAEPESFFGVAGIGDLIATCMSKYSRNHTVGFRIAQGENIHAILSSMREPAEGVNTLKIVHKISKTERIHTPIVHALYAILFDNMSIEDGLKYLMSFSSMKDVQIKS